MKSRYELGIYLRSAIRGQAKTKALGEMKRHGFIHYTPLQAYEAAAAISKHDAVEKVTCTFLQEKPEGVWRKGRHTQE